MNLKTVGFYSLSLFSLFCLNSFIVSYADWEIQPLVESRVGYSDNIDFDDDDEESGFVGQVNPGITINKLTGRLQVQLDYLMQNFYYFDDSQLDTDHNLDAIARYAVIPETFFINTFASATQVLIDNAQQISVDNFNDTGNTTDEYSYGLGPQWVQDIGNYARANLSYLYAEQRFDDETADDGGPGDLDDNDRQTFLGSLSNIDPQSDRFDWIASYEWDEVDFETGDTFEFITHQLDVGYQITPRLELLGSYGYEDNDLGDNNVFDDDDGSFWTLGLLAGLGEFTSIEIRRAERFFGNFWLGSLTVGGPKLTVTGTYEERADLSGLSDVEFNFDSTVNALELFDNDVEITPDDNNSVSVTKSWNFALVYNISKSTFLAQLSNDDQEFLDTGNTEKLENYSIGWIWQITGISSLSAILELQKDDSVDAGGETESEFYDFELEYQRSISPKTDFDVTYSYTEGDSDDLDGKFTANTITAGIQHRF